MCHGKRGTIHQAYHDGMESRLGMLGLVFNAMVLWTTNYIDAVARLNGEDHELRRRGRRLCRMPHGGTADPTGRRRPCDGCRPFLDVCRRTR